MDGLLSLSPSRRVFCVLLALSLASRLLCDHFRSLIHYEVPHFAYTRGHRRPQRRGCSGDNRAVWGHPQGKNKHPARMTLSGFFFPRCSALIMLSAGGLRQDARGIFGLFKPRPDKSQGHNEACFDVSLSFPDAMLSRPVNLHVANESRRAECVCERERERFEYIYICALFETLPQCDKKGSCDGCTIFFSNLVYKPTVGQGKCAFPLTPIPEQ